MGLKLARRVQVHYHGSNTAEAGVHTVRLPKESTAADVCETLRRQLPEDGRPARLRLLEVFYSKIYKARAPAPMLLLHLGLAQMLCQRACNWQPRWRIHHVLLHIGALCAALTGA